MVENNGMHAQIEIFDTNLVGMYSIFGNIKSNKASKLAFAHG
jgi:hypothetical protein